MAPVGARKDWAVSGERLAFYTTKKLGVKVKSGKVGNTGFVDPSVGQEPSDNVLFLVARVEPNPQCVISLDFCTRKARYSAQNPRSRRRVPAYRVYGRYRTAQVVRVVHRWSETS